MAVDIGCRVVLLAVEASAGSSGRPCGVYMFFGSDYTSFLYHNVTGSTPIIRPT